MTAEVIASLALLGFGTSLTIGLPLVLVGLALKLVHLWK